MSTDARLRPANKVMFWIGWALTILSVVPLVMGGVMSIVQPKGMDENFEKMGWPMHVATTLAVLSLGSAALYLIPQTSVLGAILMTGYLGGAVATHLRIDDPLMNTLTPVIVGALVWLGLFLRDSRIRALIPIRLNQS